MLEYENGDETRETVLSIQDFKREDLNKKYNCTARNGRGMATSRAVLKEEGEHVLLKLNLVIGYIHANTFVF